MQLFQINRSEWISVNQEYRIQYFIYRGGLSEWVISRKNSTDNYFSAIAAAATIEDAKIKYFEIVKAAA